MNEGSHRRGHSETINDGWGEGHEAETHAGNPRGLCTYIRPRAGATVAPTFKGRDPPPSSELRAHAAAHARKEQMRGPGGRIPEVVCTRSITLVYIAERRVRLRRDTISEEQ